jgi:hypothetical protein
MPALIPPKWRRVKRRVMVVIWRNEILGPRVAAHLYLNHWVPELLTQWTYLSPTACTGSGMMIGIICQQTHSLSNGAQAVVSCEKN